jgi:hypothetical protein
MVGLVPYYLLLLIQMITSVLIIAISALLFMYWLRYSCVLLLRSAKEQNSAINPYDERFAIFAIQQRIQTESDLAPLEHALQRDYQVVTYIIEHATDLELASIENKLLVLDYRLMRVWSRLTRTLAPQQSRQALSEMASVIQVLVAQMGDQKNLQAQA